MPPTSCVGVIVATEDTFEELQTLNLDAIKVSDIIMALAIKVSDIRMALRI